MAVSTRKSSLRPTRSNRFQQRDEKSIKNETCARTLYKYIYKRLWIRIVKKIVSTQRKYTKYRCGRTIKAAGLNIIRHVRVLVLVWFWRALIFRNDYTRKVSLNLNWVYTHTYIFIRIRFAYETADQLSLWRRHERVFSYSLDKRLRSFSVRLNEPSTVYEVRLLNNETIELAIRRVRTKE